MPVIPATWEVEVGGSQSYTRPGKRTRPYKKQIKAKRAEGMVQVVDCLLESTKI
jgi:hypothetical protein